MTLLTGPLEAGRLSEHPPALLALIRTSSLARTALEDRDAAIVAARRDGHTWREIAAGVGLTENGCAAIYSRRTRETPA